MRRRLPGLCFVLSLPLLAAPAAASDKPPEDAMALSAVAKAVEEAGYGPIEEATFDDGHWEIETYQDDTRYELRVDPRSGEITNKEKED